MRGGTWIFGLSVMVVLGVLQEDQCDIVWEGHCWLEGGGRATSQETWLSLESGRSSPLESPEGTNPADRWM